jgi:hypothetical protein
LQPSTVFFASGPARFARAQPSYTFPRGPSRRFSFAAHQRPSRPASPLAFPLSRCQVGPRRHPHPWVSPEPAVRPHEPHPASLPAARLRLLPWARTPRRPVTPIRAAAISYHTPFALPA